MSDVKVGLTLEDRAKPSLDKFRESLSAAQKAFNELIRIQDKWAKEVMGQQKKAQSTIKETSSAVNKQSKEVKKQSIAVSSAKTAWRGFTSTIKEAAGGMNLVEAAGRGLALKLIDIASNVIQIGAGMANLASDMLGYRNALQLVTGSQEEAEKSLSKAINIARTLRLDIKAVTKEYSKFMNSVTLAGVATSIAEDIFISFAGAARVLNLDAHRTSGMFLALEQMASKGTVSMEELRRQLGDHIPGALNLAAEAMGYTKSQLRDFIKEVSRGNVEAAELLPKMAKLIAGRTQPLIATALKKFSSQVQSLMNEFTLLSWTIGQAIATGIGPLIESITDLLVWFNGLIGASRESSTRVEQFKEVILDTDAAIASTASTVNELSDSFTMLASTDATANLNAAKEEVEGLNLASMAFLGIMSGPATSIMTKLTALWVSSFGKLKTLLQVTATSLAGLFGMSAIKAASMYETAIIKLYLAFDKAWFFTKKFFMFFAGGPWRLLITGTIAAGAAITNLVMQETKAIKSNNIYEQALEDTAAQAKEFTSQLQDMAEQMSQLGHTDLAVSLELEKNTRDQLQDANSELEKMRDNVKEVKASLWNRFVWNVFGVMTEDMKQAIEYGIGINEGQKQLNETLKDREPTGQKLLQQGKELAAAYTELEKSAKEFVKAIPLTKIKNEIELLNLSGVALAKRKVELDRNIEKQKLLAKGKLKTVQEQQAFDKLTSSIVVNTGVLAANRMEKKRHKEFVDDAKGNADSLKASIKATKEEIGVLGLKNEALDRYNLRVNITNKAIELSKLVTEAKTQSEREAIAVQAVLLAQYAEGEARLIDLKKATGEYRTEFEKTLDKMKPYQREFAKLDKLFKDGSISVSEYSRQLQTLRTQFNKQLTMEGAENGLAEYIQKAGDTAQNVKETVVNAFKAMEDAIVDFAMTGKFSFSDFANSIISDMVRIMARKAATNLASAAFDFLPSLTAFLPFAKGGFFDDGVQAFAKGGTFTNKVVDQPTMFKFAKGTGLMGEAGPEAIMPLTRTADGDLGVRTVGASSVVNNVNVVVNVENGNSNTSSESDSQDARALGGIITSRVKQTIIEELRPGGLLNKV